MNDKEEEFWELLISWAEEKRLRDEVFFYNVDRRLTMMSNSISELDDSLKNIDVDKIAEECVKEAMKYYKTKK